MNIRTGIGFDVHQLVEGEEFWLGGILLDYHKGGLGHSDADVLLHAICDALLGAANLGDIGKHFPDTSADYKGIDSKILLKRVSELISEKDYKISNIDSTI
ncbi:MAG: 2-C-methyl-D-erythritol 2,4-cyclodiphosphate synthase, partial [Flavobacteriales bacterium]